MPPILEAGQLPATTTPRKTTNPIDLLLSKDQSAPRRKLSRQMSERILMDDIDQALERVDSFAGSNEELDNLPTTEDAAEEEEVSMVDAKDVPELVSCLRRNLKESEKKKKKLGEAPDISQLLERCRQFGGFYSEQIHESGISIRESFEASGGVKEAIAALDTDSVFRPEHVIAECIRMDGVSSHLIAPEKGIRKLTQEAIELVYEPALQCVTQIYNILREAANIASENMKHKKKLYQINEDIKGCEAIIDIFKSVLDDWKDETVSMTKDLVEMEASMIDNAFFVERERLRKEANQAAPLLSLRANSRNQIVCSDVPYVDIEESPGMESILENNDDTDMVQTPTGGAGSVEKKQTIAAQATMSPKGNPRDYRMGFMDKQKSNGQSWQRRFFVMSENHGRLYIFHSPNERRSRATVDLSRVTIDDTSEALEILLTSMDGKAIYKERNELRLRADTTAARQQWAQCLRRARANVLQPLEEKNLKTDTSIDLSDELMFDPKNWIGAEAMDLEMLKDAANDARLYSLNAHKRLATTIPKHVVYLLVQRAGGDEMLSMIVSKISSMAPNHIAEALGESPEITMARTLNAREIHNLKDAVTDLAMLQKLNKRLSKHSSLRLEELPVPNRIIKMSKATSTED